MATACSTSSSYTAPTALRPSSFPPPALEHRATNARKLPLFDVLSTSSSSQEWTAAEMTLLRARLQKAQTCTVLLQPGRRARVLTEEERERLRREMEEDQRSEGSSAVGSWCTDEESIASPRPNTGIAAVLAAAALREGKRGVKDFKGHHQHIEHAQGTGPLLLSTRPRTAAPSPASSLGGVPLFPRRSASCSPPRQSIRIEGFDLPGDAAPSLIAPTISPLAPMPPPATPAANSILPSLLFASRPSTPSPSQIDSAEEGPHLSGLSSGPSSSDGGRVARPRQHRSSTDATVVAPPSAPRPPLSAFLGGTSNPSRSTIGPRLPAIRRATTSCASPPPISPSSDLSSDASLSLSFARRPHMIRQGSMGESFAHLYSDDKMAKREKALKIMEIRERGGRARMRSAVGSSYSSGRAESRSPRSVGSGAFIAEDEEDVTSASDETHGSEMEVVCDAFEPSVFASARSNSATSLSSASSMRYTSPPSSMSYSKGPSSLQSSPRSLTSPLSSSPPLQRSSSITTAPHRPTFPRSSTSSRATSPTVSRRSSISRHRSPRRGSDESDAPVNFGTETAEERAARLKIQRAVKEARKMEEEQKRYEAMRALGRDAAGRKDSVCMGMALRRLFGLA